MIAGDRFDAPLASAMTYRACELEFIGDGHRAPAYFRQTRRGAPRDSRHAPYPHRTHAAAGRDHEGEIVGDIDKRIDQRTQTDRAFRLLLHPMRKYCVRTPRTSHQREHRRRSVRVLGLAEIEFHADRAGIVMRFDLADRVVLQLACRPAAARSRAMPCTARCIRPIGCPG